MSNQQIILPDRLSRDNANAALLTACDVAYRRHLAATAGVSSEFRRRMEAAGVSIVGAQGYHNAYFDAREYFRGYHGNLSIADWGNEQVPYVEITEEVSRTVTISQMASNPSRIVEDLVSRVMHYTRTSDVSWVLRNIVFSPDNTATHVVVEIPERVHPSTDGSQQPVRCVRLTFSSNTEGSRIPGWMSSGYGCVRQIVQTYLHGSGVEILPDGSAALSIVIDDGFSQVPQPRPVPLTKSQLLHLISTAFDNHSFVTRRRNPLGVMGELISHGIGFDYEYLGISNQGVYIGDPQLLEDPAHRFQVVYALNRLRNMSSGAVQREWDRCGYSREDARHKAVRAVKDLYEVVSRAQQDRDVKIHEYQWREAVLRAFPDISMRRLGMFLANLANGACPDLSDRAYLAVMGGTVEEIREALSKTIANYRVPA